MSCKRIVSIGAHSLDAELMGGPIMLRYAKEGAHCTYMHVTNGRLEDPNATEEEKQAYLDRLRDQNENAAKALGGDVVRLGYISSNMPSTEDLTSVIEDYLVKEKVDLVITHWRGSMHPRHINTYDAVTRAVKHLREKGSNIKLLYGETFEDLVGFIPQAYFKLTKEENEQWLNGLKQYQVFNGEVNDFPYIPYYSIIHRIREIEVNSDQNVAAYMYASLIENELW